jgi:hypothetical protein
MSARRCSSCRRDRVQVNADHAGVLLCLRFYLDRHREDAQAGEGYAPPGACPSCGEPRGGRYQHHGRFVCWTCTGLEPLPADAPQKDPDWVIFRKAIIDTLWALDRQRFFYVDEDRIVAVCPVCRAGPPAYLTVRFHGKAPRVDVRCSLGCAERDNASAILPRKVRR